jgi:hypothetical protein
VVPVRAGALAPCGYARRPSGKESFSQVRADKNFGPITIPASEYFLLVDNRANSFDSRHWKIKSVAADMIHGKVILKDSDRK